MADKKILLSVVLATYNEERNLARCLESVSRLADEIIVVDGKSTDKTVDIARQYHAQVYSADNKPNFHINKNMAIDAAGGDWILQLDADEVVSPPLAEEIAGVISQPGQLAGYWIPRLNYFLGSPLTKGGQYPDLTLRLYKRGLGRLPAKDVHEQAEVNGPTEYLKNNLLHYNTPDFENYLLRYQRYTSLIADQLRTENIPVGSWQAVDYLFIKPFSEFFSIYVRHRGYADGFPGFVFALFSGLRWGISYIKYWQISRYPDE